MSEKVTIISIPGRRQGDGLMDRGEKTTAEMISFYRAYADRWRDIVAAIDATPDEGFRIELVRGVHSRSHIRTLQSGETPATLPNTQEGRG